MSATEGRTFSAVSGGAQPCSAAVTTPLRQPGSGWQRLGSVAPFITAALVTVWVFRGALFSGQLPGTIGDARWTIGVHEHWYAVWQGRETVRDMHYYFPVSDTLGTSDAFLVQGQMYSLARAVGLGLVNSWIVAQICFFAVGACGVAVLSRQVLTNWWSQVAFVAMACASYPVLVSLYHVQMIGFLSASWLFVGCFALLTRAQPRTGLTLIVIVPPLLALSSWYAFALVAIVIVFLTFFVVLFRRLGVTIQWAGPACHSFE